MKALDIQVEHDDKHRNAADRIDNQLGAEGKRMTPVQVAAECQQPATIAGTIASMTNVTLANRSRSFRASTVQISVCQDKTR